MKIIIVKDYNRMSKLAAELLIKEIRKKPNLATAFATGKTPKGLYKLLVKACKKKEVDFSKIKAFNLDEYYPIKKTNRKSFYYYLHKNLFDKVNIKKENIYLLNGEAKNYKKECKDYENKIKKNKIDLMILGVGVNGHIAFNEPGSLINSKTRLVELENGKKAFTIGISTILSAKKIILLASSKKKAEAIRALIKGNIDKCCPVSFLGEHKNLIVVIDKGAGSLLG